MWNWLLLSSNFGRPKHGKRELSELRVRVGEGDRVRRREWASTKNPEWERRRYAAEWVGRPLREQANPQCQSKSTRKMCAWKMRKGKMSPGEMSPGEMSSREYNLAAPSSGPGSTVALPWMPLSPSFSQAEPSRPRAPLWSLLVTGQTRRGGEGCSCESELGVPGERS